VTPPDHKAALRARLRAARRIAATALPDAAEAAALRAPIDRLSTLACVGAYHAMGSELDPSPLVRRLAAMGVPVALPMAQDREAPLEYRIWNMAAPLAPDIFGVPAPPLSAPLAHPDLVIVPLLGFDREGRRLGQGGGTYDRTLANLRASRRVFVLGLAYSVQESDEIPWEPHDERLDAVLTEASYIEFGV
jgi:5-formyltetrahydrofolate cyclo-ligase